MVSVIDFLLSTKRDAKAAKRFFRKALGQPHTVNPRTITVDRNPAYPCAIAEMKADNEPWRFARLRQRKFFNNIVEQDHRRVKRSGQSGAWLRRFPYSTTSTGRLRGNGNDQEGAGTRGRRTRHAGPSHLCGRVVPGRRLIRSLPRPFATCCELCNGTGRCFIMVLRQRWRWRRSQKDPHPYARHYRVTYPPVLNTIVLGSSIGVRHPLDQGSYIEAVGHDLEFVV